VDLEFLAQYLLLRHCREHPDLITGNTADVFDRLASKGLIPSDLADQLSATTRLWLAIQWVLRLTVGEKFDPESAPKALKARLAKIANAATFEDLDRIIEKCGADVREAFSSLIEIPAKALPDPDR
jgi:glutamate-ammonia-ligase adenylyltransferase